MVARSESPVQAAVKSAEESGPNVAGEPSARKPLAEISEFAQQAGRIGNPPHCIERFICPQPRGGALDQVQDLGFHFLVHGHASVKM
jgi:hypothetical protein